VVESCEAYVRALASPKFPERADGAESIIEPRALARRDTISRLPRSSNALMGNKLITKLPFTAASRDLVGAIRESCRSK